MAISVMQRYEMKYLMSREQTDFLVRQLEGHMQIDEYGMTPILSLYYDTPDARLIRDSLEKPAYKEKIRLRSYGLAEGTSPVFLELKRKSGGIVYKRRIQSTIPQVENFFEGGNILGENGQIQKEITYFRDFYKTLEPSCLILCDRTAYFEPGTDLRLTIDYSPRYRAHDLTLTRSLDGIPLLDEGWTILEIKVQQSMPLWLSSILSEGQIFKSSFSKYGEAYKMEAARSNKTTIIFVAPHIISVA